MVIVLATEAIRGEQQGRVQGRVQEKAQGKVPRTVPENDEDSRALFSVLVPTGRPGKAVIKLLHQLPRACNESVQLSAGTPGPAQRS